MEKGIGKDVICAGVIAVLLHGAVILVPCFGGWRGTPVVADVQVLTVSLCGAHAAQSASLPAFSMRIAGAQKRSHSSGPGDRGIPHDSDTADEQPHFQPILPAPEGDSMAGQVGNGFTVSAAAYNNEESPAGAVVSDAVFFPPHYLHNPAPSYPFLARRRGFEGVTVLSADVRPDGRVAGVRVKRSSGYDILDAAAMLAVEKWIFEPARRGGVPVECPVDVPVRFTLHES